ncbi:MAG: transporter, family, multidrug resistance protein [Sphingomonadales bacterium]|jgi:DHA2 family multidrug resistance protein|nr:transporter, family, multidrug resistance protein [Sphingomonadales bacterium]
MAASAASAGHPPPLAGMPLALASVALALGTFMQVLDTTIANVAVPTVAGNLGVSASQGTWVITSFAVSNGVSVPLTGWLMGRYGVVRTFVASVALFTIASLLCGLAWNISSLIVFRVLQGAVSGPMIPGSQALLLMIFPPKRRTTALAIWSMTTLIAPVFGPILGGYISDNWSWPWIFLINGPVGLVCTLVCWRYLKDRETPTRKLPVDGVGFGMLVVWVGALQVMLDTGKEADWFSSPAIVVELLVALVGFVAWLIWELHEEHPIVDLSLFRSRNFAIGTIAFGLSFAVFFGNNLLLPLWLQTQMGYVAVMAGLVSAPSGVVAFFLTPIGARFLSRLDARLVATLSLVAFAASFWMRSGYTPDATFFDFMKPLLVQGIGMSLFFTSMLNISLRDVPPERIPAASGLSNFCRISAGSFAASVTTTLWDDRAALHQTRLAEAIGGGGQGWNEAMQRMQDAGLGMAQAVGVVTQTVVRQAYMMAALDFFWASAGLTLLLVPLIWLSRRPGAPMGPAAAD